MDLVVCRKGLDAAKIFAENGGWESFEKMLDDLGISEDDTKGLWWETTEPTPTLYADAKYNEEKITFAEVIHGRLALTNVVGIIWGSHQEVRIVNIDY